VLELLFVMVQKRPAAMITMAFVGTQYAVGTNMQYAEPDLTIIVGVGD
jgi:hypothetical protein